MLVSIKLQDAYEYTTNITATPHGNSVATKEFIS
ncbi:hypothetical protein Cflav_PD4042 [Pedosphaera parvula Ellin514]|uniref:Uncharacterized protein n=1 Tax=Pedosphaera parvula (strain Ellin514) TaxID=320771 RepID=B9XGV2_PEDPL|nr:hypothetical protein Cflav_PD4042 [Pedosphaera parvula Ellin514]